jgi:patatin-like phospholipase/acyl hydrolase
MTTTTTLGEEETKTCLLKNIYMHPFSKKSCLSLSYFRVLKFRVPQEEEEEEEDLDDKNARDSQRRRRRRRRMASAKVMTPPTTTTVRRVT